MNLDQPDSLRTPVHQLYLDNLSHVLDHNYHWREGECLAVRLITINTTCESMGIDDQLAAQWASNWTTFIQQLSTTVVGRASNRLTLSRGQRHFLKAGLPVLELSGNGRLHIHLLIWERTGESVFAHADRRMALRLRTLARTHLHMANIDTGEPTLLCKVVDGQPCFTWEGQRAVLNSTRYLRSSTSRRLYELLTTDTARTKRRGTKVDEHLTKTVQGRKLLDCSNRAALDKACQITELDDTSMNVRVTSSRLRYPYRRIQVLNRLLDELDLEGAIFSFDHPAFTSMFDPRQLLEQARILAVHGAKLVQTGFDPRKWCDRPGVFSTLYQHRARRCLRPLRADIELMDQRLFGHTYESAEQLFIPARIWWSKGVALCDHQDI